MKNAFLICEEGDMLKEHFCKKIAEVNGLTIRHILYVKAGNMPQQDAFNTIFEDKSIDALVIFDIALLTRDMEKLVEYIKALLEANITIVTCTKSTISPFGEGYRMLRLLDSVHYEYKFR